MRKNTKIILVSMSLLAGSSTLAATVSPVLAANKAVIATNQAQAQTTVTMKITKTGSQTPSEAVMFLGNSAQIVLGKNGEVRIHIDGNSSPRTKGQDMSKMISSLKLNGINGKQDNLAKDGSSLDYVFPISAYKTGKSDIEFTLNVMGHTMNEQADLYFGSLNKTVNKDHKTTENKKAKKAKKTSKSKKHATKRRLKHNAYIYKRNGKRANKKTLKKGKRVSTYGKAIKLHGKYFYKISKTHYIKKANF